MGSGVGGGGLAVPGEAAFELVLGRGLDRAQQGVGDFGHLMAGDEFGLVAVAARIQHGVGQRAAGQCVGRAPARDCS